MITVAFVWTGDKYSDDYPRRLVSMVRRHADRPVDFLCLTDRPADAQRFADHRMRIVDVSGYHLPGWWAKMLLFHPGTRGSARTVYFDLDTVICNSLAPLFSADVPFGICANFARAAGAKKWPCKYGSCVMSFAPGYGAATWRMFSLNRASIMDECGRYGDQKAIEMLSPPGLEILQHVCPAGFFLNKRDFESGQGDAAVLIFGGKERPHNSPHEWIRQQWR